MTADERLALVRLKIERADKHISDLKVAVRAFLNSNPYKVATKRNPDTRQLVYYITSVTPIPADFATIVGDILNNLRSALDHLAQQLYLVGSGNTGYRDQTSFPIAETSKKFKAGFPGKVEGMRQDAINAIRALEPYKGGKGADLWFFHRLNNVDKHRLIITVGSAFKSMDFGPVLANLFNQSFPDVKLPDMVAFFNVADNLFPLKAGDELFIDVTDAKENEKLQFRCEVVIHEPGVIEGKPVLETVVEFSNRIGGIVESFKPCLA